MNTHLKCLLIFVGLLVSMAVISIGTHLFLDWLAEIFTRETVAIGLSIFLLGLLAVFTHMLCSD